MCFTFLHGSCWLLLFATGSDPRRGDGSLLRSLSDLMPVIADQSRCDHPTQSCDQSHALLRSAGHARGMVLQVSIYGVKYSSRYKAHGSVMPVATAWKSHHLPPRCFHLHLHLPYHPSLAPPTSSFVISTRQMI